MSGGVPVHRPVLFDETLDALAVRADGVYVDGTFGRGGHSAGILARLGPQGRLLAFDKDQDAVRCAEARFGTDPRFSISHASFTDLAEVVDAHGLSGGVDGMLLDLGVSSPQIDDAERGFSFMQDGPLDMRMDRSRGQSAAEWLQVAQEQDIAAVIYEYGEERFSRRIAAALVRARAETPILTTLQLARLVEQACPVKERHKHPSTRTFQAIRIYINSELDDLTTCLQSSLAVLAGGARLAVISFHSLEDRIVKRFMRDAARGEMLPKGLPVRHVETHARLHLVGKAIRANETEIKANPRARSAVLRVAEVPV